MLAASFKHKQLHFSWKRTWRLFEKTMRRSNAWPVPLIFSILTRDSFCRDTVACPVASRVDLRLTSKWLWSFHTVGIIVKDSASVLQGCLELKREMTSYLPFPAACWKSCTHLCYDKWHSCQMKVSIVATDPYLFKKEAVSKQRESYPILDEACWFLKDPLSVTST